MTEVPWWQDAVIYQIYPRSFCDGNGDGIGDLAGIRQHLDYLADLGIDAIWLSPIYPSPNVDFGYDTSNHTQVDSQYGDLSEFHLLVKEAHEKHLRIIMDLVLNHTSDQHAWFQDSRSGLTSRKRDWYIWRKSPNNWQAAFGGSAWTRDSVSGEYYLHLFCPEQPDLNWRNPLVRQAQLDVLRFWLERGVDGFRLDVFNAYFKDAEYQNNPPAPGLIPFDAQKHIHDIDQPEMMPLLKVMRDLLDLYPGSFSVGETFLSTSEKTISYIGPNKLHTAFSFDFTSSRLIVPVFPWNPGWLSRRIIRRERVFNRAGAWPATVFSNHDLPRAASRYARTSGDEQAFLEIALLLTLPGTPFLYYGEEIGMRDIHLKKNEIMDPAGKPYWLFYKGRDGCRAPMQWDATPNAGFTSATPWLPVNPDSLVRNVTTQLKNPASLLSFCKKLIALRRASPALRRGAFHPWLSKHGVLSFLRITEEQTILVVMNFSSRWRKFAIPNGRWEPLLSNGRGSPTLLEPFEIQVLMRNA